MKVSVSGEPLRQLLIALTGPGHLIRELQATMGLANAGLADDHPIKRILDEFNAEAARLGREPLPHGLPLDSGEFVPASDLNSKSAAALPSVKSRWHAPLSNGLVLDEENRRLQSGEPAGFVTGVRWAEAQRGLK